MIRHLDDQSKLKLNQNFEIQKLWKYFETLKFAKRLVQNYDIIVF